MTARRPVAKPSARERLIVWIGENCSRVSSRERACCGTIVDGEFLRLLRRHERELARLACLAAANELDSAYNTGLNRKAFFFDPALARIHYAALGPSRRPSRKGGR